MTLNGLPQEKFRMVLKEINEDSPAVLKENIARITDWMRTQPHLPQNYDERIITTMLRGCKHNVERAKRKIDNYFSFRSKYPEFYGQRDPTGDEIRNIRKCVTILPLPDTTPDGARVTVHRFLPDPDVSEYNANALYKLKILIGDIRLCEEMLLSGDVYIFDVKHITLNQLAQHTSSLKKALSVAQEAYPQRLKQIHIINAPSFITKFVNLCKSFMKEKMRNRFYFHQNAESLLDYIPKEVLPLDYGGTGKSLQQLSDQWDKKLESYTSYFIQQEGVKSDERKRIIIISEDVDVEKSVLEGTAGSFRKLCID